VELLKEQLRQESRLRLKTESKFLEAQLENKKLKEILTDPKKRKRPIEKNTLEDSFESSTAYLGHHPQSTNPETKERLVIADLGPVLTNSLPLFPQVDKDLPIPDQIEQLQHQLQELQQEQFLQGANASDELLQMISHCFEQFSYLVDQLEQGIAVTSQLERAPLKGKEILDSPPKMNKILAYVDPEKESPLPNLYLIETRLKEMFRL
jgi:hypothetical protein